MNRVKIITFTLCIALCLCYTQFPAQAKETDNVTYLDAAWVTAEKICLKIEPALDSFPEDERYKVMANALASRGVNTFLGTNPNGTMTIKEVIDLFNSVTLGEAVEYGEARKSCPAEILDIFDQPGNKKITEQEFDKVASCFPYCDPNTVETYIPPAEERFVPPGPEPRIESPASEL
jgi:hypothetical protein